MDSADGGAAAATLGPPNPPSLSLLAIPLLDRSPALLRVPELEAVAAALPGKKRRLRETFERLAASSPGPLPFSWEDLDAHISSIQYPVTLRFRQLQVPLPTTAPLIHAAVVPFVANAGDGVAEKGKKRKAPSQVTEAGDDAVEEIRRIEKDASAMEKACPSSQDVDGNGTTRLSPAPPAVANGHAEANGSTDTMVPLDPVAKIALVRQEHAAATRRALNAASLVQAGAANPTSQRRRPPRPVPAPAVVSAQAITNGDVEKAKILDVVERKAQELAVAHKAGEAKGIPSPPADGVGGTFASNKAGTQVDRPACKFTAVEHELRPSTTCGAEDIVPGLGQDSPSLLVSLAPKLESAVVEPPPNAGTHIALAEERILEVIKVDLPAAMPADNASPLQVSGFAEAGVDVGAKLSASAAHNTCVQQGSPSVARHYPNPAPVSSPETATWLQVKGRNANHQHIPEVSSVPISKAKKQSKVFSRNHGDRPTGYNNLVHKAQGDAVQKPTKEPGVGKGGPGQDRPAAAWGFLLPSDRRNSGNVKGKPMVNETGENSKNTSKFCNRCGSKGHVTHKCRTAKHLVELYLKSRKEKEANQICYRCGTMGHFARKCRTPKHLVDLYQNYRAAQKASLQASAPQSDII